MWHAASVAACLFHIARGYPDRRQSDGVQIHRDMTCDWGHLMMPMMRNVNVSVDELKKHVSIREVHVDLSALDAVSADD